MAYRNYATANGFIVAKDGNGDFSTISAALAAATSGTTIFIRSGQYNESPNLVAGINLVGFTGDSNTPNVIINGKCSFSSAGTVSISNIQLKTNSDFCLSVTGSAASVVLLNNCYINCLNNTGLSNTSSSASSGINLSYCTGNLATTGIALHTSSSPGSTVYNYCNFTNTGASTTITTASAGVSNFFYCNCPFPIGSSSTAGIGVLWSNIDCGSLNTTALTANGSGATNIRFNYFASGTASAVSVGAGANLILWDSTINSSNVNTITGAGILNYFNSLDFTNSKGINTTTQFASNAGAWTPGITVGGTTTGITYSTQNGRYTRIGNLIFISGVMIINFTSRAGSVVLTGLPFTTSSNAVEAWAIGAAGVGTAAGKAFFLNINPNATTGNFVYSVNLSAESPIDGSNIGLNPTFYVNGVYSTV